MTKLIGVFGRKGGTGKTLISHLLSHGLSKLGCTTFLLQTDVRNSRPPELIPGRKYMHLSTRRDMTDVAMLEEVLETCNILPNSTLVIDGGANRRNVDLEYAHLVDIILIPTMYSRDDLETAEADYFELTAHLRKIKSKAKVFIILNRWPGVARKRKSIESKEWVISFLDKWFAMDMLFPLEIADLPSLIEMASTDDPRYTPMIDGKGQDIARIVAAAIELPTKDDVNFQPLTDDAEEVGAEGEGSAGHSSHSQGRIVHAA